MLLEDELLRRSTAVPQGAVVVGLRAVPGALLRLLPESRRSSSNVAEQLAFVEPKILAELDGKSEAQEKGRCLWFNQVVPTTTASPRRAGVQGSRSFLESITSSQSPRP